MTLPPPRSVTEENSKLEPLPRGRHRLPFEVVAANQRRRLLAGTAQALAERGYAALTVKHIIEAAGVSRTTFYANFDNKRDCVLAAHRAAFERLLAEMTRACASEREWPRKLRAALGALFAMATARPERMRLLTLDALGSDLTVARQVSDYNAHLAALLREGRRYTSRGPLLPDLTEEALVGAVSALLAARLPEGAETLRAFEPEVAQLVLTPYLGADEAAQIAGKGECPEQDSNLRPIS